jgi:hypothetical protein
MAVANLPVQILPEAQRPGSLCRADVTGWRTATLWGSFLVGIPRILSWKNVIDSMRHQLAAISPFNRRGLLKFAEPASCRVSPLLLKIISACSFLVHCGYG